LSKEIMAAILECAPGDRLAFARTAFEHPARMTSATRTLLFGAALAPYLALAGFDAWMHERARRVPRLEQGLHYTAAALLLAFLVAVFRDAGGAALVLLAVFAAVTAWDELGFHGPLAVRERRVHFAAYAALGLFVGAWRLLDAGG